ncbi:MAG TPA: hypothetical protein VK669_10310, partial [Candidatus Limnocylindrales bacterium]|nr:hypothetical protein [Candidatus Limnocylindrales bacterium]
MTRLAWWAGVRRAGMVVIATAIVFLSVLALVSPSAAQAVTPSPSPSATATASAAPSTSTTTTVAQQASGTQELWLAIAIWVSTLVVL